MESLLHRLLYVRFFLFDVVDLDLDHIQRKSWCFRFPPCNFLPFFPNFFQSIVIMFYVQTSSVSHLIFQTTILFMFTRVSVGLLILRPLRVVKQRKLLTTNREDEGTLTAITERFQEFKNNEHQRVCNL